MASDVLGALTGAVQLALLFGIDAGRLPSDSLADAIDGIYGGVGVLQVVVLFAGAVTFIHWLRLVYGNLPALGHPSRRFRPGWVIWGWFVPVVNLFRPKQVVNDVWRGSDPDAPSDPEEVWARPVPALLDLWWGGWLAVNLSGNVAGRYYLSAESLGELKAAALSYLLLDVASGVTGVLALTVVRRTTRRQQERAMRLGYGGPGPAGVPRA